ncbi:MAG: DUF1573 domain-containing protein [Culturomica sp.]|jgi:hypothetical protein|nr:DUF1573 domain-containing protein [Culturomica sp.]
MKYFLSIALLICSVAVQAQTGALSFKNREITLKNLPADTEEQRAVFQFKNTGNVPVIITRVVPVSSQLKAHWPEAPVAPGASSEISVTFLSYQLPEIFNYNISVFSNAGSPREQLLLAGNIVDNPKKPDLLYKHPMAGLKFKSSSVNLNTVYVNQVKKDTIYFFNGTDSTVRVAVKRTPTAVTLDIPQPEVAPGKKGVIYLTYDAAKKNDYGYQYESVILSINNDNTFRNRLNLSANIVEDFTKLSRQQLENAPVASFKETTVNFGDLKQGEKANCDFVLTNNGKSDLIIRKTTASCGCTAVALGEKNIAPGMSTTIRATFDSTGKSGRQYKSVTVITNDPKNPETILTISGAIVTNSQ